MKKIKKIMAAILVAAIFTGIFSFAASAFETYGDYVYYTEGKYATITEYRGKSTNVKVPAKLDGYIVETIAEKAFANKKTIQKIELPEDITSIDSYAFQNCSGLKEITMPRYIGMVDDYAFDGCTSLQTVYMTHYNFDDSLWYIGDYNDPLWDAEWVYTHYSDDIEFNYFESTHNYKDEFYVDVDYDLSEGDTCHWTSYSDKDMLYVDPDTGYVNCYSVDTLYVDCEVVNAAGKVVYQQSDCITVKYSFAQWLIRIFLFGWIWY